MLGSMGFGNINKIVNNLLEIDNTKIIIVTGSNKELYNKLKKIKYIFNFLLIAIVLAIVLYFSLKDNYQEIISTIFKMNYLWIFVLYDSY